MRAELTVLLADESKMDCQLLAQAMQRHSRFQVLDCVTSASEAASAICDRQPDIAIINMRLKDGPLAGLIALRRLRVLQSHCRVVMMLDNNNAELVVEAFRNGARGVFCRTGSFLELRKCTQRVHEGQVWVTNSHAEYVVQALMQAPAPNMTRPGVATVLSKREEQVARLVASGLSNREISVKLGLSPNTVKNYLFRIFEKLGFSSRIELVLYMLSQAKRPVAVQDCVVRLEEEELGA